MKPLVLLCTGGIGSGKSFVVKIFETLGVPAYDCDSSAKSIYDTDPELLSRLQEIAGEGVIRDGRLDRKAFAERLFADKELLRKVEALVHPAVIRDFEEWKGRQDSAVVIIESAILLEKGPLARVADKVVSVVAPQNVRIGRVIERDHCTEAEVLSRMSRQWSDDQRVAASDWVINNDGEEPLLPQILNILETINKDEYGKDRS